MGGCKKKESKICLGCFFFVQLDKLCPMVIEIFLLSTVVSLFTQPEIHGHRGARSSRPENSLPAFEFALENGADVLEMDLAVTKDDQLVVNHDLWINPKHCRTKDGARVDEGVFIRKLSLEQIQSYDCGSMADPMFPKQQRLPGTKIPTFKEVLEFLKKSPWPRAASIKLNVETKIIPARPELSAEPAHFARLVVDLLKEYQMIDRTIVQSFDHRVLKEVKELNPKIKTAALLAENLPVDLIRLVRLSGADILSPSAEWITRDQVKMLKAVGIQVVPWTVNDESAWQQMVDLEVDGIITDDPKGLRAFLTRRATETNKGEP